MLFNSFEFIFFFLPLVLTAYYLALKYASHKASILLLACFSLTFYSYWKLDYLYIILSSIAFNYISSTYLIRLQDGKARTVLLYFGVVSNLCLLGYFKYMGFLLNNVNNWFHLKFEIDEIILPLAISFFTFQQIAFIVDVYRRKVSEVSFKSYLLFVTFFPQLIAGPIVHNKELLPQFEDNKSRRFNIDSFSFGLAIFIIGLFKKVCIADYLSLNVTPYYEMTANGGSVTFIEAWYSTLSYTLQIYFDFSGYSDMAIGIGRMFSIRLPVNFNSPYQSGNIIEFWKRWHITLSRFLRDYVYFSFGGNRKGELIRYRNIIITMLLGGVWHGAGWTFVIWGALHGFYITINHLWIQFYGNLSIKSSVWYKFSCRALTFILVMFAWVFFRSKNLDSAWIMFNGMIDFNGVKAFDMINLQLNAKKETLPFSLNIMLLIGALLIALFGVNSQRLVGYDFEGKGERKRFTILSVVSLIILGYLAIFSISKGGEFLYFNF